MSSTLVKSKAESEVMASKPHGCVNNEKVSNASDICITQSNPHVMREKLYIPNKIIIVPIKNAVFALRILLVIEDWEMKVIFCHLWGLK